MTCRQCHKRDADIGRKWCAECLEHNRAWRAAREEKEPGKRKRLWRVWYEKNKERLKVYSRGKMLGYYHRNGGKAKQRAKKYGLTVEQLSQFLAAHTVCESCGTAFTLTGTSKAHIDHDHRTGMLRGLLCQSCNLALGHLHDSPELIARLLEYAERHALVRREVA